MSASRLEINFSRLLNRCEAMASDIQLKDWRLEKYIGALQIQLAQLRTSQSKPCVEVLDDYSKKVELLKGLIEAEKLPTATEKSVATERLTPVSKENQPTRLHMQTKVLYQQEMRDELLDATDSGDLRLRQKPKDGDVDTVLRHHHHMQAKLAEEMLSLARGLKHNVAYSGGIVKDDVKKISSNIRLAESNLGKLKAESSRLEAHNKTCSSWIWIMLLLVVVTFIWMVLFMKLFPKKLF